MWLARSVIAITAISMAWHFLIAGDPADELPLRVLFCLVVGIPLSWALHKAFQLI